MSQKKHTTINHRIDFSLIIGVHGANPNGNPIDENMPRCIDVSSDGFMSDVCLKHKMRMRAHEVSGHEPGKQIFMLPSSIDPRNLAARITEHGGDVDRIKKAYFDVRAFGAVLIDSNNTAKGLGDNTAEVETPADGSTGKGKTKPKDKVVKKTTSGVVGAVSVSHAFSTAPITITRLQISRCAVQNDKETEKDKKSTFGNKFIVTDALYKATISVNARIAARNGFTYDDLALIEDSIIHMFDGDASAARPAGSMWVASLIKVEHNNTDGCCNIRSVSARHTVNESGVFVFNSNGLDILNVETLV